MKPTTHVFPAATVFGKIATTHPYTGSTFNLTLPKAPTITPTTLPVRSISAIVSGR